MTERARLNRTANVAVCSGCGAQLATRGATVRLADRLVPRPDTKDGMPRFGPNRRPGRARHADAKLVNAATREIGNPASIYVNCPACDRAQIVRWD